MKKYEDPKAEVKLFEDGQFVANMDETSWNPGSGSIPIKEGDPTADPATGDTPHF